MANLKPEFNKQAGFIIVENGKTKRIPIATFQRESKKYIALGYGNYFDISQEEAVALAAKGKAERKANKAKESKRLADLQAGHEKTAKELDAMSKEVKKLDKNLTDVKKIADAKAKENAELVNKNQELQAELERLQKLAAEKKA